jgi:GTP-binding protein EngB required for normal cell division
MNEYQQRHLFYTLQRVDELLTETERIMVSAGSPSPFQQHAQDTSRLQRTVTHDYVVRVREAMRRVLEELRIPPVSPISGALWVARGHISFALVAVADEVTQDRMRHFGDLSEDDARTIDRIVAELNSDLRRIEDFLAQGTTADLQARLQRLERTSREVELLRELDHIVTAHGLVEFRRSLEDLLERFEYPSFRIGVFGRVSSGKSSLLNHLLEHDRLPVGVTPVTAVPVRIRAGPCAQGTIEFVGKEPMRIGLERLNGFSTEQQNPGNSKHVARIDIELPARRLRQGVMFVDTPGLGSLATAGAEEAMAYLPKCDVGIVLVDAGSALSHQDIFVAQSLYRAGATAMVLVSKVDLLRPPDREQTIDYVRRQFASQANLDVQVYPVSVVGVDASLTEQWFDNVLAPLLTAHRDASAASLRRKTGLLREAVIKALGARLKRRDDLSSWEQADALVEAAAGLRGANAVLAEAEKQGRGLRQRFRELGPACVHAAAADTAAAWRESEVDAAEILSASLNRFLVKQAGVFVQSVEDVRKHLKAVLRRAHAAFGSHRGLPEDLPKAGNLPMADVMPLTVRVVLRKPPLPGQFALRRFAEVKLTAQLGDELAELLDATSRRLEHCTNRHLRTSVVPSMPMQGRTAQ